MCLIIYPSLPSEYPNNVYRSLVSLKSFQERNPKQYTGRVLLSFPFTFQIPIFERSATKLKNGGEIYFMELGNLNLKFEIVLLMNENFDWGIFFPWKNYVYIRVNQTNFWKIEDRIIMNRIYIHVRVYRLLGIFLERLFKANCERKNVLLRNHVMYKTEFDWLTWFMFLSL